MPQTQTSSPKTIVTPNRLPAFWDRDVVFFANILALFYGNEAETAALNDEVGEIASYGSRLIPILNLLFRGPDNLLVLERAPDTALCDYFADELGLPLFVKPSNMGSSVGVSKAKTVEEVAAALRVAFAYDEWAVVEEAIVGREIEVAVLGNRSPKASVPGEIVPGHEFYDYEDKYLDDSCELLAPAPLDDGQVEAARKLALRAYRTLGCEGMARVDLFLEHGTAELWVNELNTIPGFTSISMYPRLWGLSGLDYPALLDELVRLALERFGRKKDLGSRI